MKELLTALQFIYDQAMPLLGSVSAILTGLIGIFLLIPGDQPEKALQALLDFIKKLSVKVKE